MTDQRDNSNSAWQNKNLIIYMFGQLIANTGHSMASLTVIWLLKEITGSASTASFSYIVSYLPTLLVSPFAGVILDRFEKRTVMIIIDICRGVLAIYMGFLLLRGLPPLWMVMLYFLIRSLGETFYHPASEAIIPSLATKSQLVQANGIKQSALQVGGIIGPMVAALLISFWGQYAAFFADAFAFVCSVTTLLLIRPRKEILDERTSPGFNLSSFVGEMKGALGYIRSHTVIMLLMFTFSVVNFAGAAQGVLLPFYIEERLGGDINALATLSTAASICGLLVAMTVSFIKKMPYRGRLLVICLIFNTMGQLLLGFAPTLALAVVCYMMRSVAVASNSASSAIYQTEVEDHIRGRVYAFRYMLSTALAPVGVAAAGALAGFIPAWQVISIFGAVGLVASVAAMFYKSVWNV